MPLKAKIISAALSGCLVVFLIIFLNSRDDAARRQSTDDAYIRVDSTLVSPQISGRLRAVLAEENQIVRAGDVLAAIEDQEFVLQVENAWAFLAAALAARDSLAERVAQQAMIIAQAKAGLEAGQAALKLSRQEYARYRDLAADGSGAAYLAIELVNVMNHT